MATQPGGTFDTVNRKIAPHGTPGDPQSCPPCAVMIDRQIDSPMPMPWGLVVKNGSKMRSAVAGSSPGPVSATPTSSPSVPPGLVVLANTLVSPPSALIATDPL